MAEHETQREIRNIAIIAHVDHGKTTLTDALMRQTGASKEGVSMDSNSLEQERGITIYAKNASITYKETKLNIVDTPGHADFGSEVERVLRSIDSVLLVVDAQEGPMPQTRFVLRKSLELGLKPIVVINKIDKPAADPARAEEQVLELFLELGASDEQADFPVVYAIGRDGVAKRALTDESKDLSPLLDVVLEKVPPAASYKEGDLLRAQVFNLGYDNFLGRLAIARIYEGAISNGQQVFVRNEGEESRGDSARPSEESLERSEQRYPEGVQHRYGGEARKRKITKLFTFVGLERVETEIAYAGDIVLVAGIGDVSIGETISDGAETPALTAIAVDEPTIGLNFLVNNSPFAGREGKFLTSRQIRDRLARELEINVGLQVDFSPTESQGESGADSFRVYGRGEMHIAILLENMRREGYELQVSQPQVIMKEIDGVKSEPFEEVTVDVPGVYQGIVIERLSQRGFILQNIITHSDQVRLMLEGPTRGLLGYRGQFVIDTKGEGILCSQVLGFRPYAGEIQKRKAGSMISMATGKALGFSLWSLQDRGVLYIGPGVEVYEGMVIGNTSKGEEMSVNPTKGKQLSNVRASGSDEALDLVPPHPISIEIGLEIMADDEYLEVTPKSIRLRKQALTENARSKSRRG